MCRFYQPSLVSLQTSKSKLRSHLFVKRKNKFNIVLFHSMKIFWIIGVELHSFYTSVLDKGNFGMFNISFNLFRGKNPLYPLHRRLREPTVDLGAI
jgi:hypothetical protein